MKVLTKFGIVLVVLAMVTSGVSAQYMWWDNDSIDNLWVTGLNWNEGEYVDVAEVLEVLGDDPDTPEIETDFVLVPYQAAIVGYGNDLLPDGDQNVAIRNIETTTTNVGEAGAIQIDILTGDDAIARKLHIGKQSFSSDTVTVTVDGGSLTTTDQPIKLAQEVGDVAELNLISGSIVVGSTRLDDDDNYEGKELEIGQHGTGTFNMEGGTLDAKDIRVSSDDGIGYMTMSGGTATLTDDFEVAKGANSTGTLTMTGGSIAVNDSFDVGLDGNGTVIMSGNSSITDISGDLALGTNAGGVGLLDMSGTASIEVGDDMDLGKGGTGTLTMDGSSSLDISDYLYAATDGGTATVTLNGDSVLTIDDDFQLARSGGTANLNINGNAFLDCAGDDLELGYDTGSSGTMTMTGGSVYVKDDFEMSKSNPGESGTSLLTMTGGTINIGDDFKMGQCGGVAVADILAGTINVGDSLRVTHFDSSKDMSGTVGHLTLGDRDDEEIAFGAARINAAGLYMPDSPVDQPIDNWIDFLPGGLLVLDGDVTAMIQTLIDDGMLLTTYAGDYFGVLGAGEYIGVIKQYDTISADQTAVFAGVVPEPATMLLLGFGGLLLRRKRRVS